MSLVPRMVIAGLAVCALAMGVGCETLDEPETEDIVTGIPWDDDETLTYSLYDGEERIGTTTLSVERDGDQSILIQRSFNDDGESEESRVVVDADTLKPDSGTLAVVDEDIRNVAVFDYSSDGAEDCDSGIVVSIEQQVFDPPDEETPAIPRRAPLCVSKHGYDNATSLFLWRTIAFEEGYLANYETVLTGTRRTQTVRIEVITRTMDTPLGERDAWLVQISADGKNQRAWFSADDDHKMLAYQNEGFTFELEE